MNPKAGMIAPKSGMCRMGTKPCVIGMIVLGIATTVAGCATPAPVYQHWLTDEEDAALREQCENKNCVMVPGEIWLKVMQALRGDARI